MIEPKNQNPGHPTVAREYFEKLLTKISPRQFLELISRSSIGQFKAPLANNAIAYRFSERSSEHQPFGIHSMQPLNDQTLKGMSNGVRRVFLSPIFSDSDVGHFYISDQWYSPEKDFTRSLDKFKTEFDKLLRPFEEPQMTDNIPLSPELEASPIPKPFLILAGISGTGKTRWVRKVAESTRNRGADKGSLPNLDNLCLIPVRPDWHEPSDLLGYVSRVSGTTEFVSSPFLSFLVRAWTNAWSAHPSLSTKADSVQNMIPHWVGLDEMNLAPVEQYFADYLSVLESRCWDGGNYACDPLLSFEGRGDDELGAIRCALFGTKPDATTGVIWEAFRKAPKPGIPLPPNLIVVGTVNMDETTHAFSRKVLDRAFTVEFDAFSAEQYRTGKGIDPVFGIEVSDDTRLTAAEVLSTSTSGKNVDGAIREGVEKLIDSWNKAMAETPFRVAYRTLNESLLYAASKGEEKIAEAIDGILMMKLLPRLEGDSDKLWHDGEALVTDEVFDKLGEAKNTLIHAAWQEAKIAIGDKTWPDSKSKKKLHYMAKRLARTGYTSFWP